MIYYLYKWPHRYTIQKYFLDDWACRLRKRTRVISYGSLFRKRRFRPGTYIFSDFERLTPKEQERAAHVWNSLSVDPATYRLVNHPTRSLRRYGLLRMLYEEGINQFNVYRLTEQRVPAQFPVFLRDENSHVGRFTDLIHTPDELDLTINQIAAKGISLDEKLIVEFVDTRNDQADFVKYGVFRIGDQIIPQHGLLSPDWYVKFSVGMTSLPRKEFAYIGEGKFRDQLLRIFDLARIDYGRMDFGIKDGKLQVFEINSNPTVLTVLADRSSQDYGAEKATVELLEPAFIALDVHNGQSGVMRIPPKEPALTRLGNDLLSSALDRGARILGLHRPEYVLRNKYSRFFKSSENTKRKPDGG